jgi:hypothetical protein
VDEHPEGMEKARERIGPVAGQEPQDDEVPLQKGPAPVNSVSTQFAVHPAFVYETSDSS